MNIERLTAIAVWLESGAMHERIEFNMTHAIGVVVPEDFDPTKTSACGATCCIAGAAVQFFAPEQLAELAEDRIKELPFEDVHELEPGGRLWLNYTSIALRAASLLGLDLDSASELFIPWEHFSHIDHMEFNDPAWAARTIRHLIATGEVDWTATHPDNVA